MTDLEFLMAIEEYIGTMEELADGEWGGCRKAHKLIAAGEMPEPIYSETIRRIEALKITEEGRQGQ